MMRAKTLILDLEVLSRSSKHRTLAFKVITDAICFIAAFVFSYFESLNWRNILIEHADDFKVRDAQSVLEPAPYPQGFYSAIPDAMNWLFYQFTSCLIVFLVLKAVLSWFPVWVAHQWWRDLPVVVFGLTLPVLLVWTLIFKAPSYSSFFYSVVFLGYAIWLLLVFYISSPQNGPSEHERWL